MTCSEVDFTTSFVWGRKARRRDSRPTCGGPTALASSCSSSAAATDSDRRPIGALGLVPRIVALTIGGRSPVYARIPTDSPLLEHTTFRHAADRLLKSKSPWTPTDELLDEIDRLLKF